MMRLHRPGVFAALCAMLAFTALWASASGALSIPYGRLLPLLWSPHVDGDDAIWRSVLMALEAPTILFVAPARALRSLTSRLRREASSARSATAKTWPANRLLALPESCSTEP